MPLSYVLDTATEEGEEEEGSKETPYWFAVESRREKEEDTAAEGGAAYPLARDGANLGEDTERVALNVGEEEEEGE